MKYLFLFLIRFALSFIFKQDNINSKENLHFSNTDLNLRQVYINKLNSTHFSCDSNRKILPLEKFNDNYCDCEDGSDENLTNACINGKYYCNNFLYYPKIISTSKLDDGVCDCCDGTDETSANCLNDCLYLTNIELNNLTSQFEVLKYVLDSYSEESTKEYFNDSFNYISEINKTYHLIKNLYQDKILIERYLNSKNIKKNESVISEGDLNKILSSINQKINKYKNDLIEEEDNIYSLIKMGTFTELLGQNKLKLNFGDYSCELTKNKFYCKDEVGSSKSAKKIEILNFGQLSYIENNVAVFNKGYDCKGYPGVSMTAEIIFLCGKKDFFKLNYIDNLCFYSFYYYTYLACNNAYIENIIKKIDKIIDH